MPHLKVARKTEVKSEKKPLPPHPPKPHQKTPNLNFHQNSEFLAQMSNNCCNQNSRNRSRYEESNCFI